MKDHARRPTPLRWMLLPLTMAASVAPAQPRDNYYPDPSTQLRTGAPDGIGPFAAISVHDRPLGWASVHGGASPDLFLRGDHWYPGLYLYRYLERKGGVPVFGERVRVQAPPGVGEEGTGVVFPGEDGSVLGLWRSREDFLLARYHKTERRFEPISKSAVNSPCPLLWQRQGSGGKARVEFDDHAPGFVEGSHFGNLFFYTHGPGYELSERRHVVGTDGILIRNRTTGAAPLSYPAANGTASDLIVIGEGGTYYYSFTGRFDSRDQPIYAAQVRLLEKDAPLSHSSLPVIDTVDWDGDGDLDIISGDSVGFVVWLENAGSAKKPSFLPAVKLRAAGEIIRMRPGYYGSLQGPGEANWGYTCPTVVDFNSDGLPDIVLSGSLATHKIYFNRGTRTRPELAPARNLYCEGLDLHGAWRVKPGVGRLGEKMAYVLVDDDEEFHVYWRIDAQNLEDGGKLHLDTGEVIAANYRTRGRGGRVKITLRDVDHDGKNDLLLTTHSANSIPHREHGIPHQKGAMVLWMRNVSHGEKLRFASPRPLQYKGRTLFLGEHACSAAPYAFGDGTEGWIVTIENGRFFLLRPADVSWGPPPTGSAQK